MKGKREQDESGPKEITPADRVRAAHAKRAQVESGPKEITPADTIGPVPAKHVMKKFGAFVTSLLAAIIVGAVYGKVATVFYRAFPNIGMPGLIISLILMVGLMIAAALLTYRALSKKIEQGKSGHEAFTAADEVRAAIEQQDLDPPSEENDSQRTRIWLKRYFGLSNWAWTAAIIAVYEVWTEISAVKSGEGSFGTMQFTLLLAAVVGVLIFRDWLKPRRMSRVWRVLSITGVALVCSVGAFMFMGIAMVEWGSCVSGDCESGYGTFNYLSGDIYEGEFRNGQRVRGTRRYANGLTYAGEWVEGAHGQGTSTWPNGDVYVGEHLGLRPWGTGTKTYADGRVESGQWVFGTLEEPE